MLLSSESWTKIFILCNCSFVVFGVVLLTLGIQPQITLNQFRTILQNAKPEIFLVVSISGGLGVLGSFVGIYGHSKKQKVIIYLNIFILFIVTCMWIGMAFKVALTEDRFLNLVNSSLSSTIKQYEERVYYRMEFDQLQKSVICNQIEDSDDLLSIVFLLWSVIVQRLSNY
uniref:Uncharacterized protein n=1 Tax=Schistosoma haematobium TaxID=6185 RepID=A0A094ZXQ9_SCHHA